MLAKLLKYEFKATGRLFALMYGAVILLAGINAGLIALNRAIGSTVSSIVTSLTMALYMFVAVATIIVTLVIVIVRFYRMLGDQGHLWFTLPATANQHLLGKLIPAFVWSIASLLAVAISIGLVTLRTGWYKHLNMIGEVWRHLAARGYNPTLWLICGLAFILAAWLFQILMLYASMSVGPLITKSRLGGSILAYLIFYFILQAINIGVLLITGSLTLGITTSLSSPSVSNTANLAMLTPATLNQLVSRFTLCFGLEYLLVAVAFYFIARYFMTRKLNLA